MVEHGYWITRSARSSSDCGIVSPSALAVLRLMTSSNFVGRSTGRSAGLAPLRILSARHLGCGCASGFGGCRRGLALALALLTPAAPLSRARAVMNASGVS